MRRSCFEEGRSKWLRIERVRPILLDWLKRGNTLKFSCWAAGISTRTFYNWMDRAQHDRSAPAALVDLYHAYEEARAEGMQGVLGNLEIDPVTEKEPTPDGGMKEIRRDPASLAKWRLELLEKGFQRMEEKEPAPLMSSIEDDDDKEDKDEEE